MANCQDCSSSGTSFTGNYFPGSPCLENTACAGASMNAQCVYYNGPNLSCSAINTLDSLELSLQKIDQKLCQTLGSYSTYNMRCLPTFYGQAITTQAQFVDAVSNYACTTNTTLTTFTGTTFPAYQTTVNTRFVAIEVPGITCAIASVVSTDNLVSVLNKYCTRFGVINTALSISSVNWAQCFTVATPPTTIAAAFDLVISQICSVKASSATLPTFNNVGTCLAAPLTSTDTLADTVTKIRTRLCLTPTWLSTNVTWGCVTAPVSTTSIEEGVQNIITSLNGARQALPTFNPSHFTVVATNPTNACAGVTVSLASTAALDRFVATNAADLSPGTLFDKLLAGTGITLDFTTTPGKAIIAATTAGILANDTTTINFSGTGTTASPLTAVITLSASSVNVATIAGDGLLVSGSTLFANGLHFDDPSNAGKLGGDLNEHTLVNSTTFAYDIAWDPRRTIVGNDYAAWYGPTRTDDIDRISFVGVHTGNLSVFGNYWGFFQNNIVISPTAASFGSGRAYVGTATTLKLSYSQTASIPNSVIMSGNESIIQFKCVTTSNLTMPAGSGGLRPASAVAGGATIKFTSGTTSTLEHVCSFRSIGVFDDQVVGAGTPVITNFYGFFAGNSRQYLTNASSMVTSWGFYQEATTDPNFFAAFSGFGAAVPTSNVDIDGIGSTSFRVRNTFTPTSTGDLTGATGQIAWDAGFVYIKTGAGWKRAALVTF